MFIILFGNCTCMKLCYYYMDLCCNIVLCINILFNNKMLSENRFKFVVFTEKPLLFSKIYFL